MGIKSGHFSAVVLSGDDIQKFETQIKNRKPTVAAKATVKRGEALAAKFRTKGFVTYEVKKPKSR